MGLLLEEGGDKDRFTVERCHHEMLQVGRTVVGAASTWRLKPERGKEKTMMVHVKLTLLKNLNRDLRIRA